MNTYIFQTGWGWVGYASSDRGLCQMCLPLADWQAVRLHLQADVVPILENTTIEYQNLICSYFEGQRVDFSCVPVDVSGFTPFQRQVLGILQTIKYGQIITYSELAAAADRPQAIRAVGQVVAKNPLPLIIPCHRVLRKDGSLGGFSAPGGLKMKEKLLNLERSHI
ncbi:MAG: methylated-DNA--[protein]-cysteine S-methyltransferase [Planctomycetes bacterium]|jgi:methylated-DNA-[protein]-cysteine S-methyltransferase|nr:methylated-DNA--[protein]-cysteine S-methyltransferase [Planctomycetota bacterium]